MRLTTAQKAAIARRYPHDKLTRVGSGWCLVRRYGSAHPEGWGKGWRVLQIVDATPNGRVWLSQIGHGFETRRAAIGAAKVAVR